MSQKPFTKLSEFLFQPKSSFWLLIACSFWLAGLAWVRPLSLPDEGRYVGVAWEMLNSRNWLVPTLDGLPFFHKPPLFYWITAASLEIFGPIEWAGRAASFWAAIIAVYKTHSFIKKYRDKLTADLTAIILSTQPFFFGAAQYANLDMLVASMITLTVLNIADAAICLDQEKPATLQLLSGYLTAALGMLAKGLIGIVLPALIIFVWLTVTGRLRLFFRLINPLFIFITIAIASPWFIAMSSKFPQFFEYFFVEQHFRRFSGTGFNNARPFWFYIPVLILLIFPWSIWFIRAAKNYITQKLNDELGLSSLMVVWIAVILIFFSIPSSKLVGYILPTLPPISVLLAIYTKHPENTSFENKTLGWLGLTTIASCILSSILIVYLRLHDSSGLYLLSRIEKLSFRPDAQLVMLGRYQYDLPFYLKSTSRAWVVNDWRDTEESKSDNWHKELSDAARFAPEEAHRRLISPETFNAKVCEDGKRDFWIWANQEAIKQFPWFSSGEKIFENKKSVLMHVSFSEQDAIGACN